MRPGLSKQVSTSKKESVKLNEDLYNEKEIMNDQLPIVPEQLDFLVARTTKLELLGLLAMSVRRLI